MKLPSQSEVALSEFFDGHPVATFAINRHHVITHWNKACEQLLGWSSPAMVGTQNHWQPFYTKHRPLLSDLIVDNDDNIADHYPGHSYCSTLIPGAYESEDFFPNIGVGGHWLHFTAAPLRDSAGNVVGAIETLRDVTERRVAENSLRKAHDNLEHIVEKRTAQLADANDRLEDDIRQLTELNDLLSMAQQQLVQAEKMASIGQLAAGVAHEINNPIGYVHSNLGSLQEYLRSLFTVIEAYERALRAPDPKTLIPEIDDIRHRLDIDFISRDLPQLMAESREGIERVTRIVRDLKDFSYSGRDESWKLVDLHSGLESTINIIWNELKYKVELHREFGQLPLVECLPSELNQVYMNLLLNAGHAIADRGVITVRTGVDGEHAWVEFEDSGGGISPELRQRIFDPFFTTKPVGSGTGLGLSISYSIINKHNGRIDLDSTPGVGSTFRVVLPIKQPR